jgi:hypothetical protein
LSINKGNFLIFKNELFHQKIETTFKIDLINGFNKEKFFEGILYLGLFFFPHRDKTLDEIIKECYQLGINIKNLKNTKSEFLD